MQIVVPDDQSFDDHVYTGLFRFGLWRYGEWIEVTRYKLDLQIYIGYIYLPYKSKHKDTLRWWLMTTFP